MDRPSTNLTWDELACKDGTPYPEGWRVSRAIELAEIFEVIRRECGDKPITILSAYRSPEHNRKIGGARHSQHIQGRALDLRPPDGYTVEQFFNKIYDLSETLSIGGIGKYKTFVHIDTRKTGRRVVWNGAGLKDTLT